MRRLTISWRTVGATPILLAATLLPSASSCSSTTVISGAGGASSSGSGGDSSSSSGSGGNDGGGGIFNPNSSSSAGGSSPCGFSDPVSINVEVPAPGTPAEPGQICAVMASPVTSNAAATITLTPDPQDNQLASGFISIAPALVADVVGLPTIALVGDIAPTQPMTVSNVTAVAGGYSFDVVFGLPLTETPTWDWSLTAKATFDVKCDPQGNDLRSVEASTIIRLCFDDSYENIHWVSSGGICNVCDIIAEMAPSPIVADTTGDELPLADAMRLRLRLLAQIGNAVVLLAENDGGDAVEYAWQPSAGELEQLAPDVIVWRLPADATVALLQVAAHHDEGAAIATYEWGVAA